MPSHGADVLFTAGVLFVTFLAALIILLTALNMAKKRAKRAAAVGASGVSTSDRAYNALVRTEAISRELGEKGFESVRADALLQQAREAYHEGRPREAGDLAGEAGDLLDDVRHVDPRSPPAVPDLDVPESKPVLGKEYPANYLQAKFFISLVTDALKGTRKQSSQVKKARKIIEEAKAAFEDERYTESLGLAANCKRLLEGEEIPVKKARTEPESELRCPQCQAPATSEDVFCGKCGSSLTAPTCRECGGVLDPEDDFCRKCGSPAGPFREAIPKPS